jgi:valyl-tRNA synthetase
MLPPTKANHQLTDIPLSQLSLPERWIVTKLKATVNEVTASMTSYELAQAGRSITSFIKDDFAAWYIEISKTRLYVDEDNTSSSANDERLSTQQVLVHVLESSLRMLHPFMPFVTENLWHHIQRKSSSSVDDLSLPRALMLQDWVVMEGAQDDTHKSSSSLTEEEDACLSQFAIFQEVVRSIRNARAEYKVAQGQAIAAFVVVGGDGRNSEARDSGGGGGGGGGGSVAATMIEVLNDEIPALCSLAKLDATKLQIMASQSAEASELLTDVKLDTSKFVRLVVGNGIEVFLPMEGLLMSDKDKGLEKERLSKRLLKLTKEKTKLEARLNGVGFANKAPPEVVRKAEEELVEFNNQILKIREGLDDIDAN